MDGPTNRSPRPRIAVVAGYPALEAGLGALLSSTAVSVDILSLVSGGGLREGEQPDVIVADLTALPAETADDLTARYPQAALVLLGADLMVDGPGLGAGPIAYLAPDVDAATLTAAVNAVYRRLTVVDPVLLETRDGAPLAFPQPRRTTASAMDETLTPRERQVLVLVADGLPNKAIARSLGISEHTVKFHVGSLLSKLGAGSRTEAVTLATRRGLLAV